MVIASAFGAGQLMGLLILVLVAAGIVRTLSRSGLTLREKVLGKGRRASDESPRQGPSQF